MEPFTELSAVAVPLAMDNIDTDQIIPARFMRRSSRDGKSAPFFFHDLRFDANGAEKPDCIFSRTEYRGSRFVVGGRNYGCGSARMGAVYSHFDYGIRAVIAHSFGDVFYNNCLKNGIVAARVSADAIAQLHYTLSAVPGSKLTVDLVNQTVSDSAGNVHTFEIDGFAKQCLLEGLSDIDLTLRMEPDITAFEQRYYESMRWLHRHVNRTVK